MLRDKLISFKTCVITLIKIKPHCFLLYTGSEKEVQKYFLDCLSGKSTSLMKDAVSSQKHGNPQPSPHT